MSRIRAERERQRKARNRSIRAARTNAEKRRDAHWIHKAQEWHLAAIENRKDAATDHHRTWLDGYMTALQQLTTSIVEGGE